MLQIFSHYFFKKPPWLLAYFYVVAEVDIHTKLPVNAIVRQSHPYIHTKLPVNAIVRQSHPRGRDSQGQETFLAPSPDKQTRNYDTECSNHHPSLSTLRPKGLSHSKMKWWAIYTNLPVDVIVRLPQIFCSWILSTKLQS